MTEAILEAIVKAFKAEHTGKATAQSIREHFPQAIPILEQYLDYPEIAIEMWLRGQPAIYPILDDPEFPGFFLEFKQALSRGYPSGGQGLRRVLP